MQPLPGRDYSAGVQEKGHDDTPRQQLRSFSELLLEQLSLLVLWVVDFEMTT
jgi:hypothetical protein